MKLRHLTLAAGMLGAVISNHSVALGLGEIKLNSALNEPLNAQIQLLNVGEMTELEMLVGLASQQDFSNAGVERPFSLTDLRFEIDLSNPKNPVVQVTSRKPIREPYLDFLVEMDWPAGRLLREYTLLLDLPVYATEKPAAKKIEAASSGAQPTSQSQRRPVAAPSYEPALAVGDDEYRVGSGDTVWSIAQKIRPEGATMAQTMAAIKQANPSAFINDNINLLKKGAVIRLPEGSDIKALTAAESAVEVGFSDKTAASDDTQAPLLDATAESGSDRTAAESGEGRLKLAALGADEALASTSAGVNSGEGSAAEGSLSPTEQLSAAREELDKASRENAELKDRIAKLEEQLSTVNRLVEIQDDSLRGAQVATQAEPEQQQEVANAAAPDEAVAVTEEPVSSAATDEAAAAAEKPVAAQEKPAEGKSFDFASLMDYLLYPAIGLLALLLAALMFFRNRKQDEDAAEELSLQTLVDRPAPAQPEEDDAQVLTAEDKEYIAEMADELDDQGWQDLEELEELRLGEGEGVDPKGEADIYLSLGNYRQAENILKSAIDADPADASLQLKLLEVYVNSNNVEAFDQQSQQLASLNNAEADAKAAALRAEFAPSALDQLDELDTGEVAVSDFESPTVDFDLGDVGETEIPDLGATPVSAEAEEEDIAPAVAVSEEPAHQDFDLDLDLENLDLDSLASEIDQDMPEAELDDIEASDSDELLVSDTSIESFEAPDSIEEPTLEALEDAILADTGEGEESLDDFNELKAFGDEDECDTKLVLAETYLDLGDSENARDLLNEVLEEGSEEQKDKARNLLETVT